MAKKAGRLWPRLPKTLGRSQACPGRIFLVSLAKNVESPAWPGFARLDGFLTGLPMQGFVPDSLSCQRKFYKAGFQIKNGLFELATNTFRR